MSTNTPVSLSQGRISVINQPALLGVKIKQQTCEYAVKLQCRYTVKFTALNKVTEFEKCLKKFQQGLQESLLCQIGKTSYQCNTSDYVRKPFTLDG